MNASTKLVSVVMMGVVCTFTLPSATAHDDDDGGRMRSAVEATATIITINRGDHG